MAAKEFLRRREFRTVRIGGFPNSYELFVSPFSGFGVTLKLRSASEAKNQLVPGQRTADKERALFVIFSTMIGAIEIARILPDRAMRERVLAGTKEFLLRSF